MPRIKQPCSVLTLSLDSRFIFQKSASARLSEEGDEHQSGVAARTGSKTSPT
jgi:hypothetical protein